MKIALLFFWLINVVLWLFLAAVEMHQGDSTYREALLIALMNLILFRLTLTESKNKL